MTTGDSNPWQFVKWLMCIKFGGYVWHCWYNAFGIGPPLMCNIVCGKFKYIPEKYALSPTPTTKDSWDTSLTWETSPSDRHTWAEHVRKKNVVTPFLLIKRGLAFHFNKFEFPSLKNTLCQVWIKLVQWLWICGKVGRNYPSCYGEDFQKLSM